MRVLFEMFERVRALLFRNRIERDLEEELRFHRERSVERNLAHGMAPEAARRQAALQFGGGDRFREEVRDARGTRLAEDLVRDLRFALRRLGKEPGYTVPAVATVALGLGVATAVFALVNAILLRPLPYAEADRLVTIEHGATGESLSVNGLSPGLYLHYRERNRTLDGLAVYMDNMRNLTDGEAPEPVRAVLVSPELFQVLRTTAHIGRLPDGRSRNAADRRGIVLGYDLWVRRYGGDVSIIGRTIEVDRQPEIVTAVASPGFRFPHEDTQLWLTGPLEDVLARFGEQAAVRGLYLDAVARLAEGASRDQARQDLDRLITAVPATFGDVTAEELDRLGLHAQVTPLAETIVGDVRTALVLLAGTAGFLLLITLANVTNLALLRTERLRHEVALERALGAGRRRIAQRFICEGALVAGVGFALALLLAHVGVSTRFGFDEGQIPRLGELAVGGVVVGFALLLASFTAVLLATVSLGAARRAGSAGLVSAAGRSTSGVAELTVRRVLAGAQMALALTLLIGSALLTQSYRNLARVDLGFRADDAFTFLLPLPGAYPDPPATVRFHHALLERLRTLPGVESAEAVSTAAFPLTPVPDHAIEQVAAVGGQAAERPFAFRGSATPGYFNAMSIPLLRGRTFASVANAQMPEVILSASLARVLYGEADPTGREITLRGTGDATYRVVGVAGDVPGRSIAEGGANIVYLANLADGSTSGFSLREEQYIVRTSVPPASLASAIRRAIDEIDPKLVMVRAGTVEELVDASLARPRMTMLLLLVAAGTALLLGLIGIYGVLAYAVRQRTAELGIRIALGATPGRVTIAVVRDGAVLAVGGIIVGLAAAAGLTRFVRGLLYEVSPADPGTFGGMALVLLLVALAASWIPARRAGRIDPVRALNGE